MDGKEIGKKAGVIARDAIIALAEENGVNAAKAFRRIAEALDANSIKVFKGDNVLGDPELIYSEPMVDHTTRLRASELVLELHNMKPGQKIELSGGVELSNELSPEDRELLMLLKDQRMAEYERKHREQIRAEYIGSDVETP